MGKRQKATLMFKILNGLTSTSPNLSEMFTHIPMIMDSLTNSLTKPENCIQHEERFLMYGRGYTTLRRELHSHISNADTHCPSLSGNEKTKYLLRAENTVTPKLKI